MSRYYETNIRIGTIAASGFSYLSMSYFRTYLTLNFVPWLNKDHLGKDNYCNKVHRSTTLNPEGALSFYRISKSIIDGSGSDKKVEFVLQCKNNADLIFEYDPDSDWAHLTINKDGKSIKLRFPTHQHSETNEFGKNVTMVIQTGLGTFAKVLDGYLTRVGADDKPNKLPINFNEYQDYAKQVSHNETWFNINL